MIPRRTSRGILVLAVLTAVSFWLGRGSNERRLDPITGLDTRLDYALQEFEAQYFDTAGQPAVHVKAPVLTNNASSGIGVIEHPRFEVLQDGSRWRIVADSATVTADRERILLTGAVSMRRGATTAARRLEVTTSAMTLEVTPRVARSDRAVVILEGDNTLRALGFSIDMKNDSFRLDDRVSGRYVIN